MPHGENRNMGNLLLSHLYLDEEMFTLLFKALVRPHLEYAQSVWSQYLNKSVGSTIWYPATVLIFVSAHVLAYVSARFVQIYQLLHKLLSINIILKSIKGHNSVEKFGNMICISHNMDHIYQCINKIIKIHSLFLKILRKIEILTSIKCHNSVEKFEKISCVSHNTAYTKFHQSPSICSQDIKWK